MTPAESIPLGWWDPMSPAVPRTLLGTAGLPGLPMGTSISHQAGGLWRARSSGCPSKAAQSELCISLVCRRVRHEDVFPVVQLGEGLKILAESGGLSRIGVRMPARSSQRKTRTPASSARRLSLSFGSLLGAASHPRACSLPPRSGVQRGGSA